MEHQDGRVQKTKKAVVVEALRDMILAGDILPGERLLQETLADQFDVSPTPIREAIQQLVAENILSHSPYRGVRVTEARSREIGEVSLIRASVEELATRQAVLNLRIVDVKQLHTYQDSIEQLVSDGDLRAVRRLNFEFHMLIYKTAEMPTLYQIIRNLWMKFPWDTLHVNPGRAQQSINEHQAVLAAIDDGDAEAAGRAMRAHIESGVQALAQNTGKM